MAMRPSTLLATEVSTPGKLRSIWTIPSGDLQCGVRVTVYRIGPDVLISEESFLLLGGLVLSSIFGRASDSSTASSGPLPDARMSAVNPSILIRLTRTSR